MLLSDYIEFAADRSVMYEEDNPFAKRLFDALASFVDRRSRIEKVDRQSLIKNFNKKWEVDHYEFHRKIRYLKFDRWKVIYSL